MLLLLFTVGCLLVISSREVHVLPPACAAAPCQRPHPVALPAFRRAAVLFPPPLSSPAGSPAAEAGLQEGDKLVKAGPIDAASYVSIEESLVPLIRAHKGRGLTVRCRGRRRARATLRRMRVQWRSCRALRRRRRRALLAASLSHRAAPLRSISAGRHSCCARRGLCATRHRRRRSVDAPSRRGQVEVLRQSAGSALPSRLRLSLLPHEWSGNGLLGCVLHPLF